MHDQTDPNTSSKARFPTFQRLGRRLCSRQAVKRLGIAALGVITLIALFYAVENWRGAREWRQVRADLVAKNEPLSFAELVPAMPPDGENFATSPFFEGVLDKSIDPRRARPSGSSGRSGARKSDGPGWDHWVWILTERGGWANGRASFGRLGRSGQSKRNLGGRSTPTNRLAFCGSSLTRPRRIWRRSKPRWSVRTRSSRSATRTTPERCCPISVN